MLEYGFGHWKNIADCVGKGMQKCRNHYHSVYLQSHTLLPTPVQPAPARASSSSTNPVSQSQKPAPPSKLTHLPLRADFEFEWDEPAEEAIANLTMPASHSETQVDAIVKRLQAFDARLHRREVVKEYLLEPPVLQVSDDDPHCLRNEHMLSDRICVLAWLLADNVFQSFYNAVMLEFRKARSVFRAARRQNAQLLAGESQLKPNTSVSKSNASAKRRRSGKARSTPFSKRKRSSARIERPQSPFGDITLPNTPDSQPMSPKDVFSPSWSRALEPCVQPSPAILQKAKRLRLVATSPTLPLEPKHVEDMEDACKLTVAERNLCAILHISPRDFLEMKDVMLSTVALQMRRRNAKQSTTTPKISIDKASRRLDDICTEKKRKSSPHNENHGNPQLVPPTLTLPDINHQFIPNRAHPVEEPSAQPVTKFAPSVHFDRSLHESSRGFSKRVPSYSLTSTPDVGDAEPSKGKNLGRVTCKSKLLPPPSDTQLKHSASNAMCVEDPTASNGMATLVISDGEEKQYRCENPASRDFNEAKTSAGAGLPGEPSTIYLKLRLKPPSRCRTRTPGRESRVKRVAGKRYGRLPAHATHLNKNSNELAAANLSVEKSESPVDGRNNHVNGVALEEQRRPLRRTRAVQSNKDPSEAAYKGSAYATSNNGGFTARGVRACNFRSESSFSPQMPEYAGLVTRATDSNATRGNAHGSTTSVRDRSSRKAELSKSRARMPTAMVAHPLSLRVQREHASTKNQQKYEKCQVTRSKNTKLTHKKGPSEQAACHGDVVGRGTSLETSTAHRDGDGHMANSTFVDTGDEVETSGLASLNVCKTPERNSLPGQSSPNVISLSTDRVADQAKHHSNQTCLEVNGRGPADRAIDCETAPTAQPPLSKSFSLSESDEDNNAHCVETGDGEFIEEFLLDWGTSKDADLSNGERFGAIRGSARRYWETLKPEVVGNHDVDDEVKPVRSTRERVKRASAVGKRYQESSETSGCPDSNSEGPSILEQGSCQEDVEQQYRTTCKRTLRPRKPKQQTNAMVPTRRSTRIQKRSRRILDYSPDRSCMTPKRRRIGSSGTAKESYTSSELISKENGESDEYVPNSSKHSQKRTSESGRRKSTKSRTPTGKRVSGRRAKCVETRTASVEIIIPEDVRPRSCTISSDSNSSDQSEPVVYSSAGSDITGKRYELRKKSTA